MLQTSERSHDFINLSLVLLFIAMEVTFDWLPGRGLTTTIIVIVALGMVITSMQIIPGKTS